MRLAPLSSSPTLVGRSAEVERLDRLLADATRWPLLLLVAGDAGIGKTRLVGELEAGAHRRRFAVLSGGCIELAGEALPFAPILEAFRPSRPELEPTALDILGTPASPPGGQARLFELVRHALVVLALDRPVVLVLEDLHWADRSTLALLHYLVRNLADRVLVVGTYRTDAVGRSHPLRSVLGSSPRADRVEVMPVGPLGRDAVAELVTALLQRPAEPAVADQIWRRSEGNPLFVEELVAARDGGRRLPETLRDMLLARVDSLSPAAQQVLRALAVGGDGVTDALLAGVEPGAQVDRAAALREAVAAGLLVHRPGDDAIRFRHALVREAVYDDLLPGERTALHTAFAAALEGAGAEPGDIAHHWFAAHDLPRALPAALVAATAAERRYGFAEALHQYERALEIWSRLPDAADQAGETQVAVLQRAAAAANLVGDHARAASFVRAAAELVPAGADPELAGVLQERLGRYLWAAGNSSAALHAYEQAVAIVPACGPSPSRARVLASHGQALMLLARYRQSAGLCRDAISMAQAVRSPAVEGHALNTLGVDLAYLGDAATGISLLERAPGMAEAVGDLDDVARAYENLCEVLAGPAGRPADAIEWAEAGICRTNQAGMARDYGVSIRAHLASALYALGRWDEAQRVLSEADGLHAVETAAMDLRVARLPLTIARGDFAPARRDIVELEGLCHRAVDPRYCGPLHAARLAVALWQGDHTGVATGVSDALAAMAGTNDTWFTVPILALGLRAATEGHRQPRRHREASALIERVRDLAGAPGALAAATRAALLECEAHVAQLYCRDDPDLWQQAHDAWQALGRPYPTALAAWQWAESLLCRHSRDATARQQLIAAHRVAVELGAAPLRVAVEALARRARFDLALDPAPPKISPPSKAATALPLSSRELEVLKLVARGCTNRQIGAQLFISEKTTSAHVSHILDKLGVRTRVAAASIAHAHGVLDAHGVLGADRLTPTG